MSSSARPLPLVEFGPCMLSSHWPIRSIAALPSPKMPDRFGMLGREIAGLERFERGEFLQPLAGFDEGRVLEAAVLSRFRVGERVLAADAHDEVGIVEVHRPFLAAADHDRRDPGGLELLHRAEEIVPGLDVLGLHASLVEQLLVVIEDDLAHLERHADDLAVDLERIDGGRREFDSHEATSLVMSLRKPALSWACMTPPPQL